MFLYAAAAVLDVVFFTLLGARFVREIRAGRAKGGAEKGPERIVQRGRKAGLRFNPLERRFCPAKKQKRVDICINIL